MVLNHKKILSSLLSNLISSRGKDNYTNLSRYNELSEKTYRLWFNKKLDFLKFNQVGNNEILSTSGQKIAALECSFVNKSGEKTYDLAKFWDSKQGKAEKGLEISTLAIVDVDYNTAYHVSTRQTSAQAIMVIYCVSGKIGIFK